MSNLAMRHPEDGVLLRYLDGELPCSAGCLDAPLGRVFGEPQRIHTVGVHRRVTEWNVQASRIHFGDVRQERRRVDAIAAHQLGQIMKKRRITNLGQRVALHESTCMRGSLVICLARTRP